MTKKLLEIYADKPWHALSASFLLLPLIAAAQVHAATTNAISQNFEAASTNISAGALVSLASTTHPSVGPANTTNLKHLVGIASDSSLLELSGAGKTSVPVVVDGTAQTLVSDMNGAIRVGDKITASPVNGIGMKATASGEVVGTAEEDFSSVQTIKQSVRKLNGSTRTVIVGLLPVAVNVTFYSVPQSQGDLSNILPPFLQSLANNISGRQVAPLRVLIGGLALMLGFIAAMIMLYTSIRSNITSIGRNPMAQSALRKALVDVIFAAISVLAITMVTTYIVLVT